MVAQLPGQFVHHLLEDDGVDVEPEHVEEEPVPHLGLLDDDVDALLLDQAEADVEQIGLHSSVREEMVVAMVTGMMTTDLILVMKFILWIKTRMLMLMIMLMMWIMTRSSILMMTLMMLIMSRDMMLIMKGFCGY